MTAYIPGSASNEYVFHMQLDLTAWSVTMHCCPGIGNSSQLILTGHIVVTEICNLAYPALLVNYQFETLQRRPDSALARDTLDWKPTAQLKDGVEPAIEYFYA